MLYQHLTKTPLDVLWNGTKGKGLYDNKFWVSYHGLIHMVIQYRLGVFVYRGKGYQFLETSTQNDVT